MHATVPHTYNYNWFSISFFLFIVYIEINAERGASS